VPCSSPLVVTPRYKKYGMERESNTSNNKMLGSHKKTAKSNNLGFPCRLRPSGGRRDIEQLDQALPPECGG
jgi:hypothetical protein